MNNNIFLIDEETGKEVEFEIVDAIEEKGQRYILVIPIDESEDEEAFILEDVSKNNKEAVYKIVDDEETLTKIASYFMDENKDYSIEF